MRRSIKSVLYLMVVSAGWMFAQHSGTLEHVGRREIKAENRFIIAWTVGILDDPNTNQVDIFDEGGRPVASVNVLRPTPEARSVSIYDVSARPGVIAIAAVYERKKHSKRVAPAAALLTFDFSGRLSSAFVLKPWQQIYRLTMDEQSNIWTLTNNGGKDNPSIIPMVVEYSLAGAVLRELLPHSLFPLHARSMTGPPSDGRTSMGYESGVVWFWLAGSTDLVTVSTRDGKPVMMKTELPTKSNFSVSDGEPLMIEPEWSTKPK